MDSLYTSRREFISGGLTFLSAATTLPLFLGHTAHALAAAAPRRGRNNSDRILVVIQLAGGNDGLNTVVPYEADAYYRARRRIAIPKDQVLPLEDGLGLHPAADGLKWLYDEGLLAIVQGVGYPNPNRSHFTSMDIWHTADPQLKAHSGWLGRYFDAACRGADPDPIDGVALMSEAPLALQGERFMPLAFENARDLQWRPRRRDARAVRAFETLNNVGRDGLPAAFNDLDAYLQRAALQAHVGAEQIRRAADGAGRAQRRGARGGRFAQELQMVARMIQADMPTRIYYVSLGGFDTHTAQQGRHQQLLGRLGDGLRQFMETLGRAKLDDRVLVMCFSEFGRRVEENASGGTDHGQAAPMFLLGKGVKPGIHEQHPSLERLDRGDLRFGCDFRRVYATVLQKWLDMPARRILQFGGGMLPVVK